MIGNPGDTSVGHHVRCTGSFAVKSTAVSDKNNASVDPSIIGAHDCNCLPPMITLLLTDTSTSLNSECTSHPSLDGDRESAVGSTE